MKIRLNAANSKILRDHRLEHDYVLPASGFLQLALQNYSRQDAAAVQLNSVNFSMPLVVPPEEYREVAITAPPMHQPGKFIITSAGSGQAYEHAQGQIGREASPGCASLDLHAIASRCSKVIVPRDYYALYRQAGLNYGPYLRVLAHVYFNTTEALAELALADRYHHEKQQFLLHPAIMDGAIQSVGVLSAGRPLPLHLPFYIESMDIIAPLAPRCFCYTLLRENSQPKIRVLKHDVMITDVNGVVQVKITNLWLKAPTVKRGKQ